MSSDILSSKKTRTFRAKVLRPAGARFLINSDTYSTEVRSLCDYISDVTNMLPPALKSSEGISHIPQTTFGDTSILTEATARELMERARDCAASARLGNVRAYLEQEWKLRCHTRILSTLESQGGGLIALKAEESWPALTLPTEVFLAENKPDYSIAFEVDSKPMLMQDILDAAALSGANAYINEAREQVFPFIVAESKSRMGSSLEALNQCAQSVVKMLYKLSKFGPHMEQLPVFCIVCYGSSFELHVACTRKEEQHTFYEIVEIWTGDISSPWQSLQFQFILYKLSCWLRHQVPLKIDLALQSLPEQRP